MKKILTILLAVISINVQAQSNWIEIAHDADLSTVFIDSNSLSKNGSIRIFWYKLKFLQSKIIDGKKRNEHKGYTQINCVLNNIKGIYFISYLDKRIVDSEYDNNVKSEPIVPDSLGEIMKNYVCGV